MGLNLLLILIFACLSSLIICEVDSETFLYFAYGSNLLEKRIHINNPSATYYANANLSNYRLDYGSYWPSWNGSIANIIEDKETAVTGVLYTLDVKDMPNLDKQEGVNIGLYYPKNVTVKLLNEDSTDEHTVVARTYILVKTPKPTNKSCSIVFYKRPSITYRKVIEYGAREHNFPADYIQFILSYPDNGWFADDTLCKQLGPEYCC